MLSFVIIIVCYLSLFSYSGENCRKKFVSIQAVFKQCIDYTKIFYSSYQFPTGVGVTTISVSYN